MSTAGHRAPLLRAAIFGRWRPAWTCLIVMALLLNAAAPMLAAAAAQWQGRAIGEICSVYGVDLAAERARHRADAGLHATTPPLDHVAGVAPSADEWQNDRRDDRAASPADHGRHDQNHDPHHDPHHDAHHCALTGLAVCAMLVVALLMSAAWAGTGRVDRRVVRPKCATAGRQRTLARPAPARAARAALGRQLKNR